jgi:IMP dehydrogenase
MDTVTLADMAIALARDGGIGIIHGKLSPEDKRRQARKVKLHLNGVIESPICASTSQTVQSLMAECDKQGYGFRTFPVIGSDDKLQGVLTNHNLRFWNDPADTVADIMTGRDQVVSMPVGTDIASAYEAMLRGQLNTLPLVNKDGSVGGLYIWSDVKRLHTGNPDDYALDAKGHLLVGVAINTRPEEAAYDVEATREYTDVYVIDSSHGNSLETLQTLRHLRDQFGPELQIIAGNVVDDTSAILLADAGASAIKVGIGGGAICTTREQTGNGMGQLSAVYRVVRALRNSGFMTPVISDGGIKHPGDAAKLIAVGAESVMMGNAFAGTDEAPGDIVMDNEGKPVKQYRGMGSTEAQLDGRATRGYSSGQEGTEVFSEGVVAQIDYKGPVSRVIFNFKGGMRNAISNANANTIPGFQSNVRIGRITAAGAAEGSPHVGTTSRIISR